MNTESYSSATPSRKRVPAACEACRATKIKCQPSEQPGVCKKCLDCKKECVSRTGPRTRRRRTKYVLDDSQQPPPPRPSKTFTIDFNVPSQPEYEDSFDSLRDAHNHGLDSIFPPENDLPPPDMTSPPLTPPSSYKYPMQSLHAKPQFNLDSAAELLSSFKGMLVHYPCVLLRQEETVAGLAAERPFVLLAILAVASGSRTLQGHSLYDEEFRKVLGLKYVAGGERSLELLQGILIYCTWYPLHLRPRSKYAVQYIRMANDLARDLEIDQEIPDCSISGSDPNSQHLVRIRTYLAYYYTISSFKTCWKRSDSKMKIDFDGTFTNWTSTCCDMLQGYAETDGDIALTYLVRLASSANAENEFGSAGSEQQARLLLLGLETQHKESRESMQPHIACSVPVKLADLFLDVFLPGGIILDSAYGISPPIPRLRRSVTNLGTLFNYLVHLDQAAFLSFTNVEWTKFILSIILAVRLSFPNPHVPDWDDTRARTELGFDVFLKSMCSGSDLTPVSTSVDVLSAVKVVLQVVKTKYDRRVAMLKSQADSKSPATHGCPMFDRSMDQFISAWDPALQVDAMMVPPVHEGQQPVFHDLWATMTMGWAGKGGIEMPQSTTGFFTP